MENNRGFFFSSHLVLAEMTNLSFKTFHGGFGSESINPQEHGQICGLLWGHIRVGGNMSMKQMKCSPPLKGRAHLWGDVRFCVSPAPVFILWPTSCSSLLFLLGGFLYLCMWSLWNFSMSASFIKSPASPCYLFKIKLLTLLSKCVGLHNCTLRTWLM